MPLVASPLAAEAGQQAGQDDGARDARQAPDTTDVAAPKAAASQDAFWEMHDLLLDHQGALRPPDLAGYAAQLGLDIQRFTNDLRRHAGAARVAEDVDSADLSRVSGTPTFFINGIRHHGAFDIGTISAAVRAARARAAITT